MSSSVVVEPNEILTEINIGLQELQITDNICIKQERHPPFTSGGNVELSLLELITNYYLNPIARSGRTKVVREEANDQLVAIVKRDFNTRRMKFVDLKLESELSHVSDSTVYNELKECDISAYREKFVFNLIY